MSYNKIQSLDLGDQFAAASDSGDLRQIKGVKNEAITALYDDSLKSGEKTQLLNIFMLANEILMQKELESSNSNKQYENYFKNPDECISSQKNTESARSLAKTTEENAGHLITQLDAVRSLQKNEQSDESLNTLLITQISINEKSLIQNLPITETSPIVGIQNAGKSCYLNSALQILSAVDVYREKFDPRQNKLKQRKGENDLDFEARKNIQHAVFEILKKVNKSGNSSSNQPVSKQEVSDLRELCLKGKLLQPDPISGMDSGPSAVNNLLELVGFEDEVFKEKRMFQLEKGAKEAPLNDGIKRDSSEYTGFHELDRFSEENFDSNFEISLRRGDESYHNKKVSMQQLVNENWASRVDSDRILYRKNSGEDEWYSVDKIRLTRELNLKKQSFPKVLVLNVPQVDQAAAKMAGDHRVMHATITNPEEIYPAGVNPSGKKIGPKYKLKAIIEQMPDHYVAHRVEDDGSILTADDSTVRHRESSSVAGEAYYYVLEE